MKYLENFKFFIESAINENELYRFDKGGKLDKILSDGIEFKANDITHALSGINPLLKTKSFSERYAISFTRNANLKFAGLIRTTFDRNRLKNTYKLNPVSYIGARQLRAGIDTRPGGRIRHESEERIFSNKIGYLSPKYFKEICVDICLLYKEKEIQEKNKFNVPIKFIDFKKEIYKNANQAFLQNLDYSRKKINPNFIY